MMIENRAFSAFEIRSVDEEKRVITGMATTPKPDRMDDVVEPLGLKYAPSIPLFLYHDSAQQVGTAHLGKATRDGVPFTASIAKVTEPGRLKDMVDEAWQRVKYKLITAVSIGFRPLQGKVESLKNGGLRFLEAEVLELSLVPIPAQPGATINTVKSLYMKSIASPSPAASGHRDGEGARTTARAGAFTPKGNAMETMQQQVAALRDTLKSQRARMQELDDVVEKDGGISDDTRAEVNDLRVAIADNETRLAMKESQVENSSNARPVLSSRSPSVHVKRYNDVEEKFQGENGLKRVMCQLASSLDIKQGRGFRRPSEIAEQRYGKSNPTLVAIMKANEVPGAGSGSGEALAELVSVDNRFTGDFIEYLYGETVFDKIPFRELPRNVAVKGMDGAYTGYWVGESKPIPMSQGSASSVSTSPLKVAGLTVLSNELIRDSSPAALNVAGDGLRAAIAQTVDTKFFSTDAASAGVSPAGILNGVSATSTNGGDADSIRTDMKALFAPFITAKNGRGFVWVMNPTTALALSLMQNALGQVAFPGMMATGGTFQGFPVYVGDNIGTGDVILLQPSEIWKIGDTGVDVSISTDAMIEQSSAPTGATDTPTAASQAFTSMFQEESTAIKVVRGVNWGKRRASAVAYVGDAAWGSENS